MAEDEVTKKHYEMIAAILAAYRVPKEINAADYKRWLRMVTEFEDALAKDNPNFKRSQFLEACNAIGPNQAGLLRITREWK